MFSGIRFSKEAERRYIIMSSDSITCNASFAEEFTKAFTHENNPDYAVNWAILMCCCCVFIAIWGVVSGAEFLGNLFVGMLLLAAVYFVIIMFVADKASAAHDTETLEDFLEEHSFVKEFLE